MGKTIAIYAEKFDVACRIATSLSGISFNGKMIDSPELYEKNKDAITKSIKPKGYIEINYQGDKLLITWGQGHMCGLKNAKDYDEEYANWKNMPVPYFPQVYQIKVRDGRDYKTGKATNEPDKWTVKQLGAVKRLFDQSDLIISATDFEREGELIFAYVCDFLGVKKKPMKKMKIDSQTKEAFIKSYANLLDFSEIKPRENAGRGRSIADWVVGINLSTATTLQFNSKSVLSIGRVQTPTLNLIVQREKEILNFVSKPFWRVVAEFANKEKEKFSAKHEIQQFFKKEEAEKIIQKINSKKGIVEKFDKSKEKKNVPFLYNLTSLSMDANKKYGFTATETLNIAQSLYDAGLLSYPRTSSQHLPSDAQGDVDNILSMLSGYSSEYKNWIDMVAKKDRNYTKRHFDTTKVDAHSAIIPTASKPGKLDDKQKKLYDLVAKSLIRIIFKPAELEKTEITIDVQGEKFISKGSVILNPTWLIVDAMPKNEDLLPVVSVGDILDGKYDLEEGKTTPPQRYTDETLLSAMRTAGKNLDDEELKKAMMEIGDGGIGTSATRAGIIETLMLRKYAYRKGKQIIPSEQGIELIDIFPVEDIKSAELTAEWETKLMNVEKGKLDLDVFIKEIEEVTKKWCKEVQSAKSTSSFSTPMGTKFLDAPCPICGGKIKSIPAGFVCENFDKEYKTNGNCGFFLSAKIQKNKIAEKEAIELAKNKTTKKQYALKTKNGDDMNVFLVIKDNSIGFSSRKTTDLICPKCGSPLVQGEKGLGCSGYPKCNFIIWNKVSGYTLTDADKKDLIKKKKTKAAQIYSEKKQKYFTAHLVLNDDFDVKFEFPNKK